MKSEKVTCLCPVRPKMVVVVHTCFVAVVAINVCGQVNYYHDLLNAFLPCIASTLASMDYRASGLPA